MSPEAVTPPTPQAQVDFLQNLQRILDEGSFTSTYKFALIRAIADAAVERGDESGAALTIPIKELAERFVHLYWPQVAPFVGTAEPGVLQQNTGQPAFVVSRVKEARAVYGDNPESMAQHPRQWDGLVRKVVSRLRLMPLWRLQMVGGQVHEVFYEHDEAADQITLRPGVAACFLIFYQLVRELVEGAWIQFIRRTNAGVLGEQADLREFLFGSERQSLAPVRPILEDAQDGRCFYCDSRIRTAADVDHFIPWWRYPTDLGHNFVLAHPECNRRKSDHLAAEQHLARWKQRNDEQGVALGAAFEAERIRHDLAASKSIARWAYGQLAARGGQVWIKGSVMEPLGDVWEALLPG